jgi:hypothetical protein
MTQGRPAGDPSAVEGWERWYRQHWGWRDTTPPASVPQQEQASLVGVYRAFAARDGIQVEVEFADPAPNRDAATARERALRARVASQLRREYRSWADPDRSAHDPGVVVLQANVYDSGRVRVRIGPYAAPAEMPRHPMAALARLALLELTGAEPAPPPALVATYTAHVTAPDRIQGSLDLLAGAAGHPMVDHARARTLFRHYVAQIRRWQRSSSPAVQAWRDQPALTGVRLTLAEDGSRTLKPVAQRPWEDRPAISAEALLELVAQDLDQPA